MKNKNKQKNSGNSAIKEINVDSLLTQLASSESREKVGNKSVVGNTTETSSGQTKVPDSSSKKSAHVAPSPSPDTSRNPASPFTSNDSKGARAVESPIGQQNRLKKQKMRLLKKLHEREVDDNLSEESVGRPNRKQKRNYVERVSSLTGGGASKCSWKDYACVLFVLLAIIAAGLLRVQEEVFGEVDHLRQESDADYYEILGIPHAASLRDIKKAYRDKVLEVHPDHHPNCVDCQERFIASTKAYNTLVNVDQRKVYDESRGSYDPILSDFSVSLTWFNYDKLVAESSAVWVVQVYDDLDSSSKYFAQQWDGVAGSDLADIGGIKFGRVNARRDRDLLSRLPMRARTYPTVMLFTRETMPSIFSLADTSTRALRKWVIAETPSSFALPSSSNEYKLIVTGEAPEPTLRFKSASVRYSRIFDFEWKQGSSLEIALVDKKNESSPLVVLPCSDPFACIEEVKLRLLVPVNRYNIADVCDQNQLGPVHCVFDSQDHQVLLASPQLEDEVQLQRIVLVSGGKSFILDFAGSQISFDVNNGFDPNFAPIDRDQFVNQILPKSLLDTIRDHSRLLVVAAVTMAGVTLLTRVGPVQITVGVLALSMLVGLLNQPMVAKLIR